MKIKFSPSLLFSFSPFLLVSLSLLLLAACNSSPATPVGPTLTPLEARGQEVFNLNCATCHSTSPDTVIVGPSLAGVASRAGSRIEGMDAKTYIQTSVLKPNSFLVPGYQDSMIPDIAKQLTGEDFDAVVAYLLTLK
ncbi:MAG TPA: cytochrome c [Anaerolineales bacterium]|nr:cytochrome c [Anaerolineales bacterium]